MPPVVSIPPSHLLYFTSSTNQAAHSWCALLHHQCWDLYSRPLTSTLLVECVPIQ
jgi:hypothetical protein